MEMRCSGKVNYKPVAFLAVNKTPTPKKIDRNPHVLGAGKNIRSVVVRIASGSVEKMGLCELCQKNDVRVHLTLSEEKTLHICMECNNTLSAGYMGIKLSSFQPGVYEFSGIRGKKHTFNIQRRVSPIGIGYEANEVSKGSSPGFTVAVMGSVNCDQQLLFEKLKAKIKNTIFKRYLQKSLSPYGGKVMRIKDSEVAGRFEYNEGSDAPKLVIDGKMVSWEDFGRMLNAYEGFQFHLRILDITEDIK